MFTGIIQALGKIERSETRGGDIRLTIDCGDLDLSQVRSGDSMWKIAQRTLGNGDRWREIANLNPRTNADHLVVGEELRLPGGARSSGEAAPPVVAANSRAATRSDKRGRVR